ncbi:MAG: hypothetical protein ACLGG7_01430 [Bacteriovoracia bacterium]
MHPQLGDVKSYLPAIVPLFGSTQLERFDGEKIELTSAIQVRIPFVGIVSGELWVWSDLDLLKLRSNERAYARGVLGEAANILAGMALSDFADRFDGKIMLAPPHIIENKTVAPIDGEDYHLRLLDGECRCRVVVAPGVIQ